MAEEKKAFILYNDLISVVEKLITKDRERGTNEAGELFFHILEYVNGKNPIPNSFVIEVAFESIRLQLERDLNKYEAIRERNRANGMKGGRPRKEPKKPTGLFGNPKEPKKADTDTVTDTVKDIDIYSFDQFWNDYDKKVGKAESSRKWKKLSKADILSIKNHLPSYVAATPDKQYRKNPTTYLNQRSWEDEIISKNGSEEKPVKTYREIV